MDLRRWLWIYGSAAAICYISALPISNGLLPTIFFPMPIYLVIFGIFLSIGYLPIMPAIYVFGCHLLYDKKNFGKIVLSISCIIFVLDLLYIRSSWNYGVTWQGQSHTIAVFYE